jgi:anti-sigma28 factor (negative regulator of flagellin synthesis)
LRGFVDTSSIDWKSRSSPAGMVSVERVVSIASARQGLSREVPMSSVNSVGSNSPIQQIVAKPIHKEIQTAAQSPAARSDRVELSGMSHLLTALKSNEIRADKVAQIRSQIDAGTYETDDKLDAAADRLLDDLAK